MVKKFVVLLACLGALQLTSCTSNDSKEDGGGEEMAIDAEGDLGDAAEVERVEGEQSLDIAAEDTSLSGDALPEDALGDVPPPTDVAGDLPIEDNPLSETAGTDAPPADTLPPDTLGESIVDNTPVDTTPPVMESEPSSSSGSSYSSAGSSSYDDGPKEPKPVVSYRKVEQTPWREGGKLLNTVYVAREGDTWSSVSTMIYGSEKVAELKKMNPAIKGRKVKTGDKIYYNSPHRPDDETQVLTYYADNGIAPEVYIAKSGDNLKKVAKELFGTDQGWKELYATNDFESKGALDAGTQIRYWKSGVAASAKTEVAAAQPPPEPPMNEMPPAPPEEMPPEMAMNDMAPPPPPPDMAMNEMAPPPPPPPVEALAPPPPPPPPPMASNNGDDGAGLGDDDQMTTLAGGAVVAVALALFMIMRRRRKRELEQAIQDTQVG